MLAEAANQCYTVVSRFLFTLWAAAAIIDLIIHFWGPGCYVPSPTPCLLSLPGCLILLPHGSTKLLQCHMLGVGAQIACLVGPMLADRAVSLSYHGTSSDSCAGLCPFQGFSFWGVLEPFFYIFYRRLSRP